jgi:hypothetical protein
MQARVPGLEKVSGKAAIVEKMKVAENKRVVS